ncbi:MAG TPA: hypothetical protein VE821_02950, partial [Pyrinomonadaceae bacterium]|nr:hypothetical protein [Pyrinomonadaceae bacterium]
MMRDKLLARSIRCLTACVCMFSMLAFVHARARRQKEGEKNGGAAGSARARKNEARGSVRSVTIPVTLKRRGSNVAREEMQTLELVVQEDGELQEILSARGA